MEYNEKSLVIGLDLGGTNSVFGIVDKEGHLLCSKSIKTQAFQEVESYVEESVKTIRELVADVGGMGKIKGMGIGAPCGNYYKGTIEHAANLVWAKGVVPITDMFAKQLDIPVFITNDAKAAAMGEMKYGVAKGMKNFVELTLGTGVGSGIVANGQLLYGCDGFAGELGHMIVKPDGRQCGCGRKGCLETYCSATGVVRTAVEMLRCSDAPSLLHNIPVDSLSSLEVYKAAVKGDELATEVLRRTGEAIGEACANFSTFLSPEAFIFFGGLANAGDLLFQPMKEAYDKNVLSLYKGKARFLKSGLDGASAAIIGASALAWE